MFQFQAFHSPLADSIAERIARRGDIVAAREQARGQIAANLAQQQGQIWGGAIQSIGQTIGNLPQQMAAQRRQAVGDQLNTLKLQDAQRQAAGEQAVSGLMRGDQLPPGDTGPRQPSYLNQDGLFDVPKITQALGQMGMGDRAADLVKGAESINDSILKHQEAEQKAAQAHTVLLGDLADGALKMSETGTPLVNAMDFVAQPALATKRIQIQDYQQVRDKIAQLPPDQQVAALNAIRDQAAKLSPTKNLAEGATETDRYGRTIASGGAKPPNESEIAMKAAQGDPNAVKAMGLLKPQPNRTAEQDDQRYRDIVARGQMKQPISADDAAWASAYEKQKTLSVDKTASAASDRQTAAITQQTKQQERAQNFQTLQTARADIQKNADTIFSTAHTAAETLRDTVAAAQAGNKFAASQQTLEGTMATLKSQGFSRLNATELGVSANAGSIWDRISGYLGKKLEGQPVPADIQKDMLEFADILDKAAYKKYGDAHDAVNKLYGTSIPRTYQQPAQAPSGPSGPSGPREGTEGVVNGVPAVWKTVNGKAGWYRK